VSLRRIWMKLGGDLDGVELYWMKLNDFAVIFCVIWTDFGRNLNRFGPIWVCGNRQKLDFN